MRCLRRWFQSLIIFYESTHCMKIGIIGPIWYNIPPDKYGGTESVVYHLVNGLVERGHDVTLFGPATADVKATLHATTKKPTFELGMDWNNNIASQMYHITEAFDRADEFDILHMHLNKSHDYISLPLSIYSKIPVMFTLHFPIPLSQDVHTVGKHSYNREDRLLMLEKYSMLPFTSISYYRGVCRAKEHRHRAGGCADCHYAAHPIG